MRKVKYIACYITKTVEEVEIEKETPYFVWINGIKTNKRDITDTREQAIENIRFKLEQIIMNHESALKRAEEDLNKFNESL